MAYFPASCDYNCKDCSQNKCGWCAFHDCPAVSNVFENPQSYSTTVYANKEESKGGTR